MRDSLKTLKLLMPQWQGGYDESEFPGQIYPLGARLLAWLAPESRVPLVEVPVEPWTGVKPEDKDGGVFYRPQLLAQVKAARKIIEAHRPDRIITFGGDCLVSQAPFAYLNERYDGDIGLIWIDAHPDVTTPEDFDHAHAMVLGNLLGQGEALLAAEVKKHYNPRQVVLAGVDAVLPHERATIDSFGLEVISTGEMVSQGAVSQWIRQKSYQRVAIHLDLDVLDPATFNSLLFNNPGVTEHVEAERGKAGLKDLMRVLADVSAQAEVVGITFAEHMPWDALGLKKMLASLPFMK